MFTLYDLLDADPKADKQGLKEAFRKAAKVTHPDIRPDDADATWRFRQVSRAHEILSDDELRAAYDQMVAFEGRLQESAKGSVLDGILARIISGAVMAAIGAVAVVGGYALTPYVAEARIALAGIVEAVASGPAAGDADSTSQVEMADISVSDVMRTLDETSRIEKPDRAPASGTPGIVLTALPTVILEGTRETLKKTDKQTDRRTDRQIDNKPAGGAAKAKADGRDAAAALPSVPDHARGDARFFHTRGVLAYRFGDFASAMQNFDAAIRLDPAFEQAFRDRATVFSLTGRFDRAAADLAQADRLESARPVARRHAVTIGAAARRQRRNQVVERAEPVDPVVLTRASYTASWPAGG